MRSYDLSPLYRSTIGFDRLFSLLDQASGVDNAAASYPPYNIERTGENAYRLTLAVAGLRRDRIVDRIARKRPYHQGRQGGAQTRARRRKCFTRA